MEKRDARIRIVCKRDIETFLSPGLFKEKGLQYKITTPTTDTTSKQVDQTPVDEVADVILMNKLGILGGEEQSSSKATDHASSSIEATKETSDQATSPIEVVSATPVNPENLDDLISKELSSSQIQRPICEKCSEEISIEFTKDTVFLSCKHAVHYDCIDDPRKKCPTCPAEDLELFPVELTSSTAQKKRTRKSTTEKPSSKKKKTTNKDDVSTMLKKLIEELLTNTPDTGEVLEETNAPDASSNTGAPSRMKFLYLSDMIDHAEKKNEDATRNVINRYFAFGEALYLRYKELKSSYGKDGAKALVEEEVRKQIPETKFSDEALRKRRGRSEKAYKLFNSIGKSKIERIRSFPTRSILNLSDTNVDRVIAGVLRAERN